MPKRRYTALLILTILAGCGEGSQTPAGEAASTPPPSQRETVPGNPAAEEPAAEPVDEPASTPYVQAIEFPEEVQEAVEAGPIENSPPQIVPQPDQAETDQMGSSERGEAAKVDVIDPEAVEPPALPLDEPAETEDEVKEDDNAEASAQVKQDQPRQVETPADSVVALLDELERSAVDLRTFTADVLYQTEDALLGQKVARKGAIAYAVDAEKKHKKFAIRFDQIIESGRMRQRSKYYIFNDRWLVEVDHAEKTFIKREIVPPGSTFDPLKLGEGPFPLPIGQARAEVLARFDVELIELPDEGSLAALRNQVQVHGLRLKPKAGTPEAEDYDHIDLFYDKETLLPVGVDVVEANGDRKTARLENLKRNPELDDDFSVAEPDPTVWRIDVRPWQDRP
jgi:hypothetical protein